MIRVCVQSSRHDEIYQAFHKLYEKENINIQETLKASDIYIIEINHIQELEIIKKINRQIDTLIYIIGPKDFDIANECLRLNVNLYILNDHFQDELIKYRNDIINHVQERFQYYTYQRNGIYSQIRLSQIFYIESLRHSIIIHSINGEFVERKNLSEFLKEVSSYHFIQIHKSFVVNIQQIEKITNKDIIVKNGSVLPIGRVYKTRINKI